MFPFRSILLHSEEYYWLRQLRKEQVELIASKLDPWNHHLYTIERLIFVGLKFRKFGVIRDIYSTKIRPR